MLMTNELNRRSVTHDDSKFESPEFEDYASVIDEFQKHPFGSEGYKQAKAKIDKAVKHHYERNSHHPEHYTDGIEGMDLMDLVEMVCDWKAATLNNPNAPGNMENSLKFGIEKYNISPQLAKVLYNTIKNFKL